MTHLAISFGQKEYLQQSPMTPAKDYLRPGNRAAVIVITTRTIVALATSALLLLAFGPSPVAASANACLYTPTGGTGGAPGGGAIPIPVGWSGGTFGAATGTCGWGTFTSPSPACTAAGTGVNGAWCDTLWATAGAPTMPKDCAVGTAPGANLYGIAAGWDVGGPSPGWTGPPPVPGSLTTGPVGPPDGNVDAWDDMSGVVGSLPGSGTLAHFTSTTPATTPLQLHIYPSGGFPAWAPPGGGPAPPWQLIVYVEATWVGMPPLPPAMAPPVSFPVGCV